MIFRMVLKVLRWTLIAFMAALVLFCILFAILQSTWAKEKMRTQLLSLLEKNGVQATFVQLSGQPPFTWTIRRGRVRSGRRALSCALGDQTAHCDPSSLAGKHRHQLLKRAVRRLRLLVCAARRKCRKQPAWYPENWQSPPRPAAKGPPPPLPYPHPPLYSRARHLREPQDRIDRNGRHRRQSEGTQRQGRFLPRPPGNRPRFEAGPISKP